MRTCPSSPLVLLIKESVKFRFKLGFTLLQLLCERALLRLWCSSSKSRSNFDSSLGSLFCSYYANVPFFASGAPHQRVGQISIQAWVHSSAATMRTCPSSPLVLLIKESVKFRFKLGFTL